MGTKKRRPAMSRGVVLLALLAICAGMEVFQMDQMRALDEMEADLLDADAKGTRTMAGLKRIALGKNKRTDPIGDLSRQLEMADDERKRVDAKLSYEAKAFDHYSEESSDSVRARERQEESIERDLKADLEKQAARVAKEHKKVTKARKRTATAHVHKKKKASSLRMLEKKLGANNEGDSDDEDSTGSGSSDDDSGSDSSDGGSGSDSSDGDSGSDSSDGDSGSDS